MPAPPGRRELEQRFAELYPELRRMARGKLRRESTFTLLDTTALLHETFMRLAQREGLDEDALGAFWVYAASVMRSVIVDHARARLAQRRGGGIDHVVLDTAQAEAAPSDESRVLEVHEALQMLGQAEPRLAKVVEMQYFGGFTDAEIAQALEISERTVRRDWDKARLLLHAALA